MRKASLLLYIFLYVSVPLQASLAADCNLNGTEDSEDIAVTSSTYRVETVQARGRILASALADVDGDNLTDITIVIEKDRNRPQALVFKQLAEGLEFQLLANLALLNSPHTISVEDLDGNNFPDLKFIGLASQGGGFNIGSNEFNIVDPINELSTPDPIGPGSEAAVQQRDLTLNNDNLADRILVRKDSVSELEIYLRAEEAGNPEGNLVLSQSFTIDNSLSSATSRELGILPAVDLEGDGDTDLVILKTERLSVSGFGNFYISSVLVLTNDGSGIFARQEITAGDSFVFAGYSDVNKDGRNDINFETIFIDQINFPATVEQIVVSGFTTLLSRPEQVSRDSNHNAVPDECERAIAGDFGGDRRSDFTVLRDNSGLFLWLSRLSSEKRTDVDNNLAPESDEGQFHTNFGLSELDLPYAGDFNGDGKYEPGVVRGVRTNFLGGLYWYFLESDGTAKSRLWGLTGDKPQIAYFDADTIHDRAVVRNVGGGLSWYIDRSEGSPVLGEQWGLLGDQSFVGDFTGDGVSELAVSRDIAGQIMWFIRTLDKSFVAVVPWGLSATDQALPPTDFDGDGRVDLAVARSSDFIKNVYIRFANGAVQIVPFGLNTDFLYAGFLTEEDQSDLSALRKDELLNFRYNQSVTGAPEIATTQWGFSTDLFLPPGSSALQLP